MSDIVGTLYQSEDTSQSAGRSTGRMPAHGSSLAGGFEQPVVDAQSVFRAVMEAFSRPGRSVALSTKVEPPSPLTVEAGAVALALFDQDTPIWCDAPLAGEPAIRDWLAFHTGAPVAAGPEQAAFALISAADRMPALSGFAQGTADYPDRSTTLIMMVNTLMSRDVVRLAGPGIEATETIAPAPLPANFWDQARANQTLFPRGVDILFAAPGKIAALPRSTRIPVNASMED